MCRCNVRRCSENIPKKCYPNGWTCRTRKFRICARNCLSQVEERTGRDALPLCDCDVSWRGSKRAGRQKSTFDLPAIRDFIILASVTAVTDRFLQLELLKPLAS